MFSARRFRLLTAFSVCLPLSAAWAEEPAAPAELPSSVEPTVRALLPRVGDYHRAALHVDPVEAAIARGDEPSPKPGDTTPDATGRDTAWLAPDAPRARELAGGYAYATFESPADGVMLLEASGCAAVCVNGQWLPGDPYGVGWFRLPVEVRQGANWTMTHLAAPTAKPRLVHPDQDVSFVAEGATAPDLVAGVTEGVAVSVPLLNAGATPLTGAKLSVGWEGGETSVEPLRWIDSLLLTPITARTPAPPTDLQAGDTATLRITVLAADDDGGDNDEDASPLAEISLSLRVVEPTAPRNATFVSEIDGSVQAYRVAPAKSEKRKAGLLVALHDAGQTPEACLAEYPTDGEFHTLAPCGRGRWGFDWEDWSRLDALEAIDDFLGRPSDGRPAVDPRRIAVVGVGMGGHGVLRLATLHPERFAAAGVIDGWNSFFTQGGAVVTPTDATPVARLLGRQAAADDPLRVLENLSGMGVAVLRLDQSAVSASEGRFLRQRLGEFHADFFYRDAHGTPPAEALADLTAWLTARRSADAAKADTIDFATPDLGAAATSGWATILSVPRQGDVARVELTRDLARREVVGATDNVGRLRLDMAAFGRDGEVVVRLDGAKTGVAFRPSRDGEELTLARDNDGDWRRVRSASSRADRFTAAYKQPGRAGGFKSVFCCRPQLVYGTHGPDDEQAWMAAKARYDAHLFLYRGAGRLEVLPDAVALDGWRDGDGLERSVVLYGAARRNRAWSLLDREAFFRRSRTVGVAAGRAELAERPEEGSDLAILAVRPRPGSEGGSIGVVGGTGAIGMRMTTRLRYFWSGVEYPDFLLYVPRALDAPADPGAAPDVRAAGYFDQRWRVNEAGVVWRDLAI